MGSLSRRNPYMCILAFSIFIESHSLAIKIKKLSVNVFHGGDQRAFPGLCAPASGHVTTDGALHPVAETLRLIMSPH